MTDETARAAFEWHRVSSIDEMEAFYRSRLPSIKEAARACGYAIGVHGSLRRDLDLIAAPWIEEHANADTLARAIHKAACGLEQESYQWGDKPLGRIAVSFPICWKSENMGYYTPNLGCIDLSVLAAWSSRAPAPDERADADMRRAIESIYGTATNWAAEGFPDKLYALEHIGELARLCLADVDREGAR